MNLLEIFGICFAVELGIIVIFFIISIFFSMYIKKIDAKRYKSLLKLDEKNREENLNKLEKYLQDHPEDFELIKNHYQNKANNEKLKKDLEENPAEKDYSKIPTPDIASEANEYAKKFFGQVNPEN